MSFSHKYDPDYCTIHGNQYFPACPLCFHILVRSEIGKLAKLKLREEREARLAHKNKNSKLPSLHYDHIQDLMWIVIKKDKLEKCIQKSKDFIYEYNKNGDLIGVEIKHFIKNFLKKIL